MAGNDAKLGWIGDGEGKRWRGDESEERERVEKENPGVVVGGVWVRKETALLDSAGEEMEEGGGVNEHLEWAYAWKSKEDPWDRDGVVGGGVGVDRCANAEGEDEKEGDWEGRGDGVEGEDTMEKGGERAEGGTMQEEDLMREGRLKDKPSGREWGERWRGGGREVDRRRDWNGEQDCAIPVEVMREVGEGRDRSCPEDDA